MKLLQTITAAALLLGAPVVYGTTNTPERMIKQLYKISTTTFDVGNFGGKFNQSKQCQLYRDYFSPDLVLTDKRGICSIASYSSNVRFPKASEITDASFPPDMPPYEVLTAITGPNDEVAIPVTVDDGSRVMYFLKKIDGNYKIVNVMTSLKWPADPKSEDRSDRCPFLFSSSPEKDTFQLSMVPKECRRGL